MGDMPPRGREDPGGPGSVPEAAGQCRGGPGQCTQDCPGVAAGTAKLQATSAGHPGQLGHCARQEGAQAGRQERALGQLTTLLLCLGHSAVCSKSTSSVPYFCDVLFTIPSLKSCCSSVNQPLNERAVTVSEGALPFREHSQSLPPSFSSFFNLWLNLFSFCVWIVNECVVLILTCTVRSFVGGYRECPPTV